MNSYSFVDSIQAEKANALARYRRFNNISKLFRAIEVFAAVALISWSSTRIPEVFKVFGQYLYACSSYVLNQHVVFLVGNVIVVICYVLSGKTEIGTESDCLEVSEDIRFRSASIPKTIESDTNIEQVLPETKQTVIKQVEDETVRSENAIVKSETAIKQAAKQIERFQRTQSEKLNREISAKLNRRELRRSVTEMRMSVVNSGNGESETAAVAVERLSNEEFRRAVEAFISKQQSLLKQQSM